MTGHLDPTTHFSGNRVYQALRDTAIFEPCNATLSNDSAKQWVAPTVQRGLINTGKRQTSVREGAAPSPTTKAFQFNRRIPMSLNVESTSNHAKTVLLARLASTLAICARDTYEVGTDRVVRP
jgi:hypothetical protein